MSGNGYVQFDWLNMMDSKAMVDAQGIGTLDLSRVKVETVFEIANYSRVYVATVTSMGRGLSMFPLCLVDLRSKSVRAAFCLAQVMGASRADYL